MTIPKDIFAGTRYATVERLGAGAMGEVFVVVHRELGREFVAKVLHERLSFDARLLDRMRLEAESLGKLSHPNIVSVSGFDHTVDGRPFVLMERLLGRTVAAEVARRGALSPMQAVHYVQQLLAGLEAAHAVGIVHRDIKPDNLFFEEQPDGTHVLKVLDFGIARVLPGFGDEGPQPPVIATDTGIVVGSPRFVSPEGALGRKVDERADLYAAGLVLYVLLTGRGPFDDVRGESNILAAHVSLEPAAPSTLAKGKWPPILDKIVLHALRKKPDERFQSAAEFASVLRRFVEAVHAPLPPDEDGRTDEGHDRRSAVPQGGQPTHVAVTRPAGGASKVGVSDDKTQREQRNASRAPVPRHISLQQLLLFVALCGLTAVVVSRLAHAISVRL